MSIKRYIPDDQQIYAEVWSKSGKSFGEPKTRTIAHKVKQWLRTEGPGYYLPSDRQRAEKHCRRKLRSELGWIESILFSLVIRLVINYLFKLYFEEAEY